MTAKELAAAALVTAVLVVGAVTLQKDPTPTLDLSTARLVRSLDGGKAYLVGDGRDGGLFETAPCVRRRKGSAPGSCLNGGIDIGESNRFDRTRSSGPDCEPVACAVGAGEDADGAEDATKAQPVGVAK